jgi:hypothetical protein
MSLHQHGAIDLVRPDCVLKVFGQEIATDRFQVTRHPCVVSFLQIPEVVVSIDSHGLTWIAHHSLSALESEPGGGHESITIFAEILNLAADKVSAGGSFFRTASELEFGPMAKINWTVRPEKESFEGFVRVDSAILNEASGEWFSVSGKPFASEVAAQLAAQEAAYRLGVKLAAKAPRTLPSGIVIEKA